MMNHTELTDTEPEKKYITSALYFVYAAMLVISILLFVYGISKEVVNNVIISLPVIAVLVDALFIDRKEVHIPPLLIIMLWGLMILFLIGNTLENTQLDWFADFSFGFILGLVGLIGTYSLLRTVPGVRDGKPFLTAFISLSVALATYTLLLMLQYYLSMFLDHPIMTVEETFSDLLAITIGAALVSLLFYLDRHILIFNYTVGKYLEINSGTIGIEEYEIQEITKALNSGESEKVEYKSTLRTNLATGEKDTRMEKAVLKTIVAFLNSNGGTLLVGVNDDGEIIGIDESSFDNRDKLNLHMTNLLSSQIGNEFLPYISFRLVDLEEKCVMRVSCKKCDSPVFLKDNKHEIFFVRSGPSSVELTGIDLLNYVNNRFKKSVFK